MSVKPIVDKHTTSPSSTPPRPNASVNRSVVEYLTVRDLMVELRISRDTVYRMLAKNELPHFRVGNRSIRVRRDAFEDWRQEQEQRRMEELPRRAR